MSASYNICLDVGGTKVLGAIFNEKDEIIYRLKKRSKSGGSASADLEKVIIDVVEEMIKESGIDRKKLNAVASCAPGVIDQENGIVLFTPNLPWRDYDMAGAMRKQFGVPFYVGNDVNLGVLGEYHFGAARGYKNIVGFFVGTGMGGGLILDGKLFTGNQFKAAEYGHSLSRELAFLAVHGTLHILGYDHMNEAEEQLMRARQRTILERIGETR